jgi:hypothetical protein
LEWWSHGTDHRVDLTGGPALTTALSTGGAWRTTLQRNTAAHRIAASFGWSPALARIASKPGDSTQSGGPQTLRWEPQTLDADRSCSNNKLLQVPSRRTRAQLQLLPATVATHFSATSGSIPPGSGSSSSSNSSSFPGSSSGSGRTSRYAERSDAGCVRGLAAQELRKQHTAI